MSELTPCNFCTYRDLKRRYGRRLRVLRPGRPIGSLRMAVDVFIDVPPNLTIRGLTEQERDRYFLASFMALTDRCVC